MFHETLSSHLKQFICLVSYVVRQYNNLTQVKWWNGSLQNLQFRVKEGGLFKSPFITGLISLKWRYYNAQKLRTKQQISFRFLQEKVFVWGVSKQSGSLTRKWNAVFCVFIPLYTWCWLTLLFSQKKKKIYIYHLFVVTFDVIFILLGHAGRVSYVIIYIKIRLLLSALWHRGFRNLMMFCYLCISCYELKKAKFPSRTSFLTF